MHVRCDKLMHRILRFKSIKHLKQNDFFFRKIEHDRIILCDYEILSDKTLDHPCLIIWIMDDY